MVAIHRPGENPMETLHEGKTQINSVWIEIGAQSTGSDMNEWKVKKGVQLAENFKNCSTNTCKHDI